MASEYDTQRRVPKVGKVDAVTGTDKTEQLDLNRKGKFEAALGRAADEQRKGEQHRRHHTYDDAAERQSPAKRPPTAASKTVTPGEKA